MKRSFVKVVSSKFIPVVAIAATLMVCTPAQSKANDNKKAAIEIVSTENTASVKYTGSTDIALLFDVKVSNPKADKFTLIIQAEDGVVLYTKEYSDVNFSKKVKLLKDTDNSNYTFIVKSANKELETSFIVSAAVKTVDDVVVTKL